MTPGYEALRRGAAVLDLTTRGRIVVRGRDRARLLHNLTSNEVKKMTPGSACYAFLLSPQGRIQADLFLLSFAEHFLIDTEPELREKVFAHIKRYIIADQVELEDVTASTACIAVEGPSAAEILGAVGAPVPGEYAHSAWGEHTVAGLSASGQPGFRIYANASARDALIAQLQAAGAQTASGEDLHGVRVENGKPRYGEDISDRTLPQETQQMHAVSFQKGCYLGQEIVERIRAQGHVNKLLMRVRIEGAEPLSAGTRLTSNGAEAGEITSTFYLPGAGHVAALAYIRKQFATPGVTLDAAGRKVSVTP